jgi:flagellar hook-associated protein 1 FlgK
MSINQALSAALSGIDATKQALSVISGNVANANTPGYVDESVSQVATAVVGQPGAGVDITGVNRNLNTLLQSQLWTETSGGSYADTTAQLYQQLQQVYGTPGSATSFDAIYSNFTSAMQTLATSPSSSSAQSAAVSSAQQLAQNLNAMTASLQQLRSQAQQGITNDVTTANSALQQIAQLNQQLVGASADGASATLADQRDQAVTQLSQLMDIRVVQNSDNQVSVFTSNGQELVAGPQASQLSFNGPGALSATALWSATPSADTAGTITLTSPGGATTDLVANGGIQSGEIGAYLKMRDTTLPQAQAQLDELANQMSQALSNQTTAATAVTSGAQSGFSLDTGSLLAGNSLQVSYTDSGNVQHTVTVVALGAGGTLPAGSGANPAIGVDFSGGMASVVSQLNTALGANLQFSNPSGTVLQVLNAGGATVNAMTETTTATSLVSGSAQLPLFTDGTKPITGALTSLGSQTTGLAGRIAVNAAVAANPASLVSYAAGTAAGDPTRPNFIVDQLTTATLTYSPTTGLGSTSAPLSGTLPQYLSEIVAQQSQAATAATNLKQGQDTVVSALQQRFNDQSGVSIDTEMSNLITLQNAYSANARVMSAMQQMMQTLLQAVQ